MSTTNSVEGEQETRAQAHARALVVWGQWLQHWRRTGVPRALHATLVCKQIAAERFAAWRAELRSDGWLVGPCVPLGPNGSWTGCWFKAGATSR